MELFLAKYIYPVIMAVVGIVVTYLVSRPKEKVDIASNILNMYEKLIERLEAQLAKSDEIIMSLKNTIIIMQSGNDDCWLRVNTLQVELAKYERINSEQINELKLLREDCKVLKELLIKQENEN